MLNGGKKRSVPPSTGEEAETERVRKQRKKQAKDTAPGYVPKYFHEPRDLLLQSLLRRDQNAHHFQSFENLVSEISLLLEKLGRMVTKWPHSGPRALIYTFEIKDVVAHPDEVRIEDAMEYSLNRTMSWRGTMVLSCRKPEEPETVSREIKREQGVLMRLPFMTSTGVSVLEAEPDRHAYSGFFILRGKLRTVPCVQTYIHNYPILAKLKGRYILQIRCQARNKQGRSTHTIELSVAESESRPTDIGNLTVALPFQHRAPFNVAILALALGCPFPAFRDLVVSYAGHLYEKAVFAPYFYSMEAHLRAKSSSTGTRGRPKDSRQRNGNGGGGNNGGGGKAGGPTGNGKQQQQRRRENGFQTQEDAVWYISEEQYNKSMLSTARNMLKNQTLSHILTGDERQDVTLKIDYLAHCTATLILYREAEKRKAKGDKNLFQQMAIPSRHAFQNASVFTLTYMIKYLVQNLYGHHVKQNCKVLRRWLMQQQNGMDILKLYLVRIYAEQRLTSRIFSAISSGIFSATKKGATHALTSSNEATVRAQLNRITKPVSLSVGPPQRMVQLDQRGFVCLASTPDGETTGINTEKALTAQLTPTCPAADLFLTDHLILELGVQEKLFECLSAAKAGGPGHLAGCVYVYGVQGYLLSVVTGRNAETRAVAFLRRLRRSGVVSRYLSVARSVLPGALHLSLGEGCMVRPLLVAERYRDFCAYVRGIVHDQSSCRGQLGIFEGALALGMVELVSSTEQATLCLIAVREEDVSRPGVTHLEISEVAQLSANAACIPDVTQMQGPRVAYSQGMSKQGIDANVKPEMGVISSAQSMFPCRPLRCTRVADILEAYSMGQPVIVAIMAIPGTEEDGIIVNRQFTERGGHLCYETRVSTSETVKSNNAWWSRFERPGESTDNRAEDGAYDHIQKNGLPLVGARIPPNGVIICKTNRSRRNQNRGNGAAADPAATPAASEDKAQANGRDDGMEDDDIQGDLLEHTYRNSGGSYDYKCASTFNKLTTGVVQSAKIQRIKDFALKATVKMVHDFTFNQGDKASARSAQKGVITRKVDQVDMPRTKDGIVPDIIISPLGQTSRTTSATFYEGSSSKAVALSGRMELGVDPQRLSEGYGEEFLKIQEVLAEKGYQRNGMEIMYDGVTGEAIKSPAYVAIVHYFRPKQIARHKRHARSTGPKCRDTRQAKEGRGNNGGLRVGTMEFNAIIAHGAAHFMLERWCKLSDQFTIYVCKRCRYIVDLCNSSIDYFFCHRCDTREHVRYVVISFTLYVWILEQRSGGVDMRFKIRDVELPVAAVPRKRKAEEMAVDQKEEVATGSASSLDFVCPPSPPLLSATTSPPPTLESSSCIHTVST
jgi:DNA-directed RNA polymerase beta subunit